MLGSSEFKQLGLGPLDTQEPRTTTRFVHCPITSKFCIPLVLVVEYKPVPCTNKACMQPSVCIYTNIAQVRSILNNLGLYLT